MEDVPPSKMEHPPSSQSMSGRFNVPIAAQPQPQVSQASFIQTAPAPPAVPSHLIPQVGGSQSLSQPTAQTMSPGSRSLRPPHPFSDREREPFSQPARTPLVSKPLHSASSSISDSPARHPLPGSLLDPQAERQKPEPKPSQEPARIQERQMRVKQEPDLIPQHEYYGGSSSSSIRAPPLRAETMPLSSRLEASSSSSRGPPQAPQAPFTVLQHQPGRIFMNESSPSSPAPPRSMLSLSRPLSRASDPYNTPPAQRTPPSVAPAPPRAPPKTSNLMALLNDEPPAPPKRVAEIPSAPKSSSTPPTAC